MTGEGHCYPTKTALIASRDPSNNGGLKHTGQGPASSVNPGTLTPGPRVDFGAVNAAALLELPSLLSRWLPGGRISGREYESLNPRRGDRHPGSFRVNVRTGRWSDFATGDCGGDPISLAAFLFRISQIDAAKRLATMLGIG